VDKRVEKRHKRQVSRAKKKVRLSEPDLRTPEQIEAAREASGLHSSRGDKAETVVSGRSIRSRLATRTGSAAKTDG
jgi:hypothetical protein